MNKKLLVSAMAMAMAATGAQAVNVNPDGLGEVLLYPYFTVQNDFTTAIHVVNTTTQAKAVKVRFLEGKNSKEVLDFNLYLSPQDVWTGAVVRTDAGASLISGDTSCIAPNQVPAEGQAFVNYEFLTDADADNVDRLREGYAEIIEMGVLTDATQIAAVTHTAAGVPLDCSVITSADNAGTVLVSEPTGGLFGTGHLISVNGGVRTTYDATALEGFSDVPAWFTSGSTSPSLENVTPPVAYIANPDGSAIETFVADVGNGRPEVDAVSAVLTKSVIANEYVIDAGRESKTDWVVTFPTKRFYVGTGTTLNADATPFQRAWNNETLVACHDISLTYYDREEQSRTPSGGSFSPMPPAGNSAALCNEVNTLTVFAEGQNVAEKRLFGAVSTAASQAVRADFEAGWMSMTFASGATYGSLPSGAGTVAGVVGLPVVGFAALSNVNQTSVMVDGLNVFSSYMGSADHKGVVEFVAP